MIQSRASDCTHTHTLYSLRQVNGLYSTSLFMRMSPSRCQGTWRPFTLFLHYLSRQTSRGSRGVWTEVL